MSRQGMNDVAVSLFLACFILSLTPVAPVAASDIVYGPVAIAGTSLSDSGKLQLDGTLSEGWQDDSLAYVWQIEGETSPRLGPIVAIDDLTPGTYLVTLTVSNAFESDTDTMLLGVPEKADTCPAPLNNLQQQVFELRCLIAGYSDTSFSAPSTEAARLRKKTLVGLLHCVCRHIGVQDYQAAIDLLRDILEKSDGVDSPADWIVDDPATTYTHEQQDVAELIMSLIDQLTHPQVTDQEWTTAKVYQTGQGTFLFLLNESDGIIEIRRINSNGTVGDVIQTQDWSSGWTLAEFFTVDNQTHLFLLKEADGTGNVRRVSSGGTLSDVVERYNWSSGWTSAQFYSVLGNPYVFLIKASDGVEVTYRVDADGSVGTLIQGGRWAPGWTQAEFYTYGDDVFACFLQEAEGTINVYRLLSDGTLGDLIQELDWSAGYSIVEFYTVNDTPYAFFLKTSDGTVNIRRMNVNGTIGAQVQRDILSAGWTHAQFYQVGGTTYLLLFNGSDGTTRIHKMKSDGSLGSVVN